MAALLWRWPPQTPFPLWACPASRSPRQPELLTVGRDEAVIREYIKKQEQEDKRMDQLNMWK